MVSIRSRVLVLLMRANILLIAFQEARSVRKAIGELKRLRQIQKGLRGNSGVPVVFKGGGKYFINPNIPGWPSEAFTRFFRNEIRGSLSGMSHPIFPHILIFSVTRRCPLKCEHCFEWDRLSGSDSLTLNDLIAISEKFENAGTVQFQYGGGEPLFRTDDIVAMLKGRRSESWLLTSGFGFTKETAIRLKKAGLTGMKISIDHFEEDKHNSFRGNNNSFSEAVNAVKVSIETGLATGVAVCVTEENANNYFLEKYLEFAKSLGVGFVFLLEPRETGHFKNSSVNLSEKAVESIIDFYLKQHGKVIRRLPVVIYPGYHQRDKGCFGAGFRYLYVDSAGFAHACPFCQGAEINALKTNVSEIVKSVRERGCQMFSTHS